VRMRIDSRVGCHLLWYKRISGGNLWLTFLADYHGWRYNFWLLYSIKYCYTTIEKGLGVVYSLDT
jgi:hypothetical protein